jgi:hypothetical protein
MKQKFKLVVPSDLIQYANDRIIKMNNEIVCIMYGHDFDDCLDSAVMCLYKEGVGEQPGLYARVKKEWLQEIKQPMTLEETFLSAVKKCGRMICSSQYYDVAKFWFKQGWRLSLENEKLKQEMKENSDELPEKIEEIKAGPVSDEQIIIDWLDRPDQLNKQMIVWKDDLLSLIHRVKHNERKRVQLVIDKLEIIARTAIMELNREGYDVTAAEFENELDAALQQLKEQDENRGN